MGADLDGCRPGRDHGDPVAHPVRSRVPGDVAVSPQSKEAPVNLWAYIGWRSSGLALLATVLLSPTVGSAAGPDNVLFVGWGQKVDNLDPQTSRGNRNWWVLAELYDTLTVLPEDRKSTR